jgi:hypothetical protein
VEHLGQSRIKGEEYKLAETVTEDDAVVVTVNCYCRLESDIWQFVTVGWNRGLENVSYSQMCEIPDFAVAGFRDINGLVTLICPSMPTLLWP